MEQILVNLNCSTWYCAKDGETTCQYLKKHRFDKEAHCLLFNDERGAYTKLSIGSLGSPIRCTDCLRASFQEETKTFKAGA
jgi:hypothetical protein